MKILGIQISGKTPKKPEQLPLKFVEDQVPEIKVSIPDTKRPAMMPFVKNPTLRYHTQKSLGRGAFQPAEYDLAEIGRIEDTDGYVRQAFDKKVALMFKEGWDLVGPNRRTIKYIKARLAQIAAATTVPTNTLFREIGSAIVRKSNAFLIKVRKTEASGGRVRTIVGKNRQLKPVAGYFISPAETMEFELSGNRISRWQQKMPNGDIKMHEPLNIVHVLFNKKEGFVFGTPVIIPVIDDIRALRKIEENIELLIYQHLFPLFQYIVGTENQPAGYDEDGNREIEVMRREIQFMPTEGGIVMPFRHEIRAIGAEGRALQADKYLEHFKKRVFSGMGVSAVDMGEGNTANRATADNMSRNLVDSVKDLQQIVEDAVNEFIIKELLLESTFGSDVLDEENIVRLKFKEIDVDAKIKKENHAADLFEKDSITHDEVREALGLEPILLPTPEESQNEQDTADKFPEWNRMRWTMFKRPELLMQSMDEPYSLAAQQASKDSSISMGQKDIDSSAKAKNDQEVALEQERTKAKIAVAKAKPAPRKVSDSLLITSFIEIKGDIIERVQEKGLIDHDFTSALIRTALGPTKRQLIADGMIAFREGFASAGGDIGNQNFVSISSLARGQIRERIEHYVTKLANQVSNALQRNTDNNMTPTELASKTRAVFESMQFRTNFIEDVEIRKAGALGKSRGFASRGISQVFSTINPSSTPCPICISRHNTSIQTNISIVDLLPPHHAHCNCSVSTEPSSQSFQIENSEETLVDQPQVNGRVAPTPGMENTTTNCPKCGKTATKASNKEIWSCAACKHKFDDAAVLEDRIKRSKHAQFRRCVSRFKARIKSKKPEMEDDKLEGMAETACGHLRDELHTEEEIDEVIDEIIENATLKQEEK